MVFHKGLYFLACPDFVYLTGNCGCMSRWTWTPRLGSGHGLAMPSWRATTECFHQCRENWPLANKMQPRNVPGSTDNVSMI